MYGTGGPRLARTEIWVLWVYRTQSWVLHIFNCWKNIDLEPEFQISVEFCCIDRFENNSLKNDGFNGTDQTHPNNTLETTMQ